MTREKAIKILSSYKNSYFGDALHGGVISVSEIIELLSAQPDLQPTCNQLATDCISRQAAIDAIDKYSVWVMYTQGDSQNDEAELVENIIKQTKKAIQSMLREDLPSAQPDRSLWFRIGEICVDESKGFISSGRAVEKIRELLREERREDGKD